MDRRVRATQEKFVKALRILMQRYPWETITIATICQEAAVSRSTFYSHFSSKEEIMQLSLDSLAQELIPSDTRRGLNSTCTLKFLPELLNHIKQHREILVKNQDTAAAAIILRNLRKTVDGLLSKEIHESLYASTIDQEKFVFICGGLFAIIEHWNNNGCCEPAESIVATIDRLIKSALQHT